MKVLSRELLRFPMGHAPADCAGLLSMEINSAIPLGSRKHPIGMPRDTNVKPRIFALLESDVVRFPQHTPSSTCSSCIARAFVHRFWSRVFCEVERFFLGLERCATISALSARVLFHI